jgi:hypothetical protein
MAIVPIMAYLFLRIFNLIKNDEAICGLGNLVALFRLISIPCKLVQNEKSHSQTIRVTNSTHTEKSKFRAYHSFYGKHTIVSNHTINVPLVDSLFILAEEWT